MTYEEWWAYEGKRRREEPYTPETSIRYVINTVETSIIVRTPYE